MSAAIERRLRALSEDLATAVADVTGTPVTVAAGDAARPRGWKIALTASGDQTGRLVVRLDGTATTHLTAKILGHLGAATDGGEHRTADLLREVLSRAATAMAGREADERLVLVVDAVEPAPDTDRDSADAVAVAFVLEGLGGPIPVSLTWTHAANADTANGRATAPGATPGRLDVILDIDLPVVVRFGFTQMPIRALSQLGPGSVIELGRSPDDPVEVLVSNRVVARGEVVIVGGNYGVRILDVTSQSERARSMEG